MRGQLLLWRVGVSNLLTRLALVLQHRNMKKGITHQVIQYLIFISVFGHVWQLLLLVAMLMVTA